MQHVLAIAAGKIAFCETAIIYGIEQVGFTHAVGAANAHYPFGERELPVLIVFELGEGYVVEL